MCLSFRVWILLHDRVLLSPMWNIFFQGRCVGTAAQIYPPRSSIKPHRKYMEQMSSLRWCSYFYMNWIWICFTTNRKRKESDAVHGNSTTFSPILPQRVRINLIQFDFNWISLERNAPSHRQRVKWNLLLHSIQSTTNNFNRFAELNNSTDECIIWWFQLPIVHSTLYTTDNGILLTFIPQIKYLPCVVLFEQKIQPFLTPESNNPVCTLDIYHPRNIYIVAGIPLLPAVCV